jgi:hypothetical protein
MITLALTLSTIALGQNGERTQRRIQGGSLADGKYSFSNLGPHARQQNQTAQRKQLSGDILSAGAGNDTIKSANVQHRNEAGKPRNITINWGDGNNTSEAAKAQRQSKPMAIDNTLGSFSPYNKPKSKSLSNNSWGGGSFAKARVKQGR